MLAAATTALERSHARQRQRLAHLSWFSHSPSPPPQIFTFHKLDSLFPFHIRWACFVEVIERRVRTEETRTERKRRVAGGDQQVSSPFRLVEQGILLTFLDDHFVHRYCIQAATSQSMAAHPDS